MVEQMNSIIDKGENMEKSGKDLDEESTTQNFLNVAKRGDISPRLIEKVKSAAKGRRKQLKDTPAIPFTGVQTRKAITKSNN